MSLITIVEEWFNSFVGDEKLDVMIVTFEDDIVKGLTELSLRTGKIDRIYVYSGYKTLLGDSKHPLHHFDKNIMSIKDFNSNMRPCIIFADFNNSNMIANKKIELHSDIEIQQKFRRYCRGILLYNLNDTPPLNGFWCYEKSYHIPDSNSTIVKLGLSDWGKMTQSIPVFEPIISMDRMIDITSNVQVSSMWIDNLKILLSHVLPHFLGSGTDALLEHFLSDEAMIVWTRAFIHRTYNKIYSYEGIETLGDAVLKLQFMIYMRTKYPRLTETELSEYSNQYLSIHHQNYISDDLKLSYFLLADRTVVKDSNKTKTDLMESFVGAMFEIAQNINPSLSYIVTQNFVNLMGEQFSFYKRMSYGMPKHKIKQLLEAFQFNNNPNSHDFDVEYQVTGNNGRDVRFSLKISEKFKAFILDLKKIGYDLTKLEGLVYPFNLGTTTRDYAEHKIWSQIDSIFVKANVDIRFAKSRRRSIFTQFEASDPEMYERFTQKLQIQFPNSSLLELIKNIQFESIKDEEGSYIMMYINTFEAEPDSKMLRSFSNYNGVTHKAADDYIKESDAVMQVKNLSAIPMILQNDTRGAYANLNTYDLSCIHCVINYINR